MTEEISEVQIDFDNESRTKLIRITRPFRTKWDLFTMLLALYNCFTVPLVVAFRPDESTALLVINITIDFIFMIDIVLNFCTTYIDRNGDEVMDMKMIAINYFKGQFLLDLLASLPIDNFYVLNDSSGSQEAEVV